MNRSHVVRALMRDGHTQRSAEQAVEQVLNAIALSLACGEPVTIRNFGKFQPRTRRSVTRKNPVTGESVTVPEKTSVGFVPAPALKERINS